MACDFELKNLLTLTQKRHAVTWLTVIRRLSDVTQGLHLRLESHLTDFPLADAMMNAVVVDFRTDFQTRKKGVYGF